MPRLLIILLMLCAFGVPVSAQTRPAQVGDPPVLSRIEVTPPNAFGLVTLSGSAGAVFPNAYVAVRNLFSGVTVYTRAGITGGFTAQVEGTVETPYWISPAEIETPRDARGLPGSLPGGPGAILMPNTAGVNAAPDAVIAIALDGSVSDWARYPDSMLIETESRRILALRNSESLYIAIDGADSLPRDAQIEIELIIDSIVYALRFDPRANAPASISRLNPNQRELGTAPVSAVRESAVEARIPLRFTDRADAVQLTAVRWLNAEGAAQIEDAAASPIPVVDERDGIVRTDSRLSPAAPAFAIGGAAALAEERLTWIGSGRFSSVEANPGETWSVEIDVALTGFDLPADARIVSEMVFLPVAQVEPDGEIAEAVSGETTNNGWSDRLTAGGLPIDGQASAVAFAHAEAQASAIVRREDDTLIPLDFSAAIPRRLPAGLYVPALRSQMQWSGGALRWDQPDTALLTRLPVVVNVGGVETARLPMALFIDDASDGSRGILPGEDAARSALSNRVRTNSPTLILPPYTNTAPRRPILYALEPYLPNVLVNRFDVSAAPFIPFELPGGRLMGRVRDPDGRIDDLGAAPFLQNQLSTGEYDESALFGSAAPVDTYRLTTLEPRFNEYSFDRYGEYVITLDAEIGDVWGNTYSGGGEYHVLVAELLDLTPGVLSGAPFSVGDVFNPGLRLAPAFPADVRVTIRVYPLDGSPVIEQMLTGQADRSGVFLPGEMPLIFQKPGEYVIDYEARYMAADGSLWAASLRSVGVVAARESALQAMGRRGVDRVDDLSTAFEPAWFDLARYAEIGAFDDEDAMLTYPYHSGDVAWVDDGASGDLRPALSLFDGGGAYAAMLRSQGASLALTEDPAQIARGIARQEMPVAPEDSAIYVSAVRPNVTVRQFISQGAGVGLAGLETAWNNDDPLNRQIGAGIDGALPDDLIFLFGGVVTRPAEDEPAASGYAAAAVVIDPADDLGERVYPPGRGRDGGGDGGALLTFNDLDYDAVLVPTSLQPGDVLDTGAPFLFAGQLAPTLPMQVRVTYTKPSGVTVTVEGTANAFGAFYDATHLQVADESGVWSAQVEIIYQRRTSAGVVAAPGLSGGIAGIAEGRFSFYVLPTDSEPLPWNSALTDSVIAIGLPYNFNFTLPPGWTDIRATFTMTTPGYVLQAEPLRVSGRSFSYQYIAPALGRDISILERDARTSGSWVSDVRTLTFVATGTDETGSPAIRARTFTLLHDRLVTYR